MVILWSLLMFTGRPVVVVCCHVIVGTGIAYAAHVNVTLMTVEEPPMFTVWFWGGDVILGVARRKKGWSWQQASNHYVLKSVESFSSMAVIFLWLQSIMLALFQGSPRSVLGRAWERGYHNVKIFIHFHSLIVPTLIKTYFLHWGRCCYWWYQLD